MPTLTFKVTDREASRIRSRARREGRTLSEFLRRRALPPAAPAPAPDGYRVRTSRVTGLPVMHAPRDVSRVTSAQVRELLADFP